MDILVELPQVVKSIRHSQQFLEQMEDDWEGDQGLEPREAGAVGTAGAVANGVSCGVDLSASGVGTRVGRSDLGYQLCTMTTEQLRATPSYHSACNAAQPPASTTIAQSRSGSSSTSSSGSHSASPLRGDFKSRPALGSTPSTDAPHYAGAHIASPPGDQQLQRQQLQSETLIPAQQYSVEFTGPSKLKIRKEEVPRSLSPGQVLIQTAYTMVSTGTEMKVFTDVTSLNDQSSQEPLDLTIAGMSGENSLAYPLRYGYSLAGTVVAVGNGLNKRHWIGKRVFAFCPHSTCAVADASAVQEIPDDIAFEDAVFLPAVETAVSLAMAARPMVGERVAVVGQGLIGLLTTAVLKVSMPALEVTAIEVSPERRKIARRFIRKLLLPPTTTATTSSQTIRGASGSNGNSAGTKLPLTSLRTLNPQVQKLDVPPLVRKRSDQESPITVASDINRLNGLDEVDGFDVCIELSGRVAGLQEAIDRCGKGGRVIIGSWYSNSNSGGVHTPTGTINGGGRGSDYLQLGTKFHRSGINMITSQVSTIPAALSDRWTKQRRFNVAWDVLRRITPSSLLATESAAAVAAAPDEQEKSRKHIPIETAAPSLADEDAVLGVFRDLASGSRLTALLKNYEHCCRNIFPS